MEGVFGGLISFSVLGIVVSGLMVLWRVLNFYPRRSLLGFVSRLAIFFLVYMRTGVHKMYRLSFFLFFLVCFLFSNARHDTAMCVRAVCRFLVDILSFLGVGIIFFA